MFKYLVKEKDLEGEWFSDSAGTSAYHIGEYVKFKIDLAVSFND